MNRAISILPGNPISDPQFSYFTEQELKSARSFHQSLPQYRETPLVSLPHLAQKLGVGGVYVKDESHRFGLNAFKGLGASYAIARLLAERLGLDKPDYKALMEANVERNGKDIVFVTATDGNHGKSVAWAASIFGCRARVFMPKGSKESRVQAIRSINNTPVEVTQMNYDDTVRLAADWAKQNGQFLVQDTGTAEYYQIPRDITLGYTTMAAEALKQMRGQYKAEKPTHVFLQAGVGSMAGGVLAFLVQQFRPSPPCVTIMEPDTVACIYESAQAGTGKPVAVGGISETIMAGLNCGEPNPLIWPVLRDYASFFASCPDWVTEQGMRMLAHPQNGDPAVISGESGAVGVGLLQQLCHSPQLYDTKRRMGLDESSQILLFSTEGDTDPQGYRQIVGE
ncbi:diaminopropionate ammonia-lyase [Clostridium minihomine]|uniref:diaminopropionate ammonia-lyase n=1 Tax=Clostridium minihomine TaxID=2045012 RepID=UPI000C779A50|nr:diaminopropionate ammonia-lyase [Clostridium minihomine]